MTSQIKGALPVIAGATINEVAARNNMEPVAVMRQFLHSNTYSLLLDIETGLYAVGHHVIANMFEEEIGLSSKRDS